MKCLFVFVFFMYGVWGDEEYYAKLDKLTQEPPCSQAGGVCTFAADCSLPTRQSGLCPRQQSIGVECCYGISDRDTRCRSRGGECMSTANKCGPVFMRATDCPEETKCCILV